MKYVTSIIGGAMKHSFTKMGGHKKFLTFSKISSGPLPGINNDWSLTSVNERSMLTLYFSDLYA